MTDNIVSKNAREGDPFRGLRAVGYARVSTRDQFLDVQIDRIQNFFETHGLIPVGSPAIYQEKISGFKSQRKERDKVMQLVTDRAIDLIVVTKLDRWGRSVKDLSDTIQTLKDHRVNIYFIDQNLMLDDSPLGNLQINLFSMIAQFDRDLILERTRDGRHYAQLHGTRSGKPMHRPRKDTPDKLIISAYRSGRSMRDIAKELGISTATVRARLVSQGISVRSWKMNAP